MRMNWAFCFTILTAGLTACAPRLNTEDSDDGVADLAPQPTAARWAGSTGEPNPSYRTPPDAAPPTGSSPDGGGPITPDLRGSGNVNPVDLRPPADLAPSAPLGRIAGETCTADAHCASSICIGVGEPFPGVCVVSLCVTSDDCPILRGMHRPCVVNTYVDKSAHPAFCVP